MKSPYVAHWSKQSGGWVVLNRTVIGKSVVFNHKCRCQDEETARLIARLMKENLVKETNERLEHEIA